VKLVDVSKKRRRGRKRVERDTIEKSEKSFMKLDSRGERESQRNYPEKVKNNYCFAIVSLSKTSKKVNQWSFHYAHACACACSAKHH
jgi:hypothetical protein